MSRGCDKCDAKLAKKVAWKYILMKDSSYAKVAKEMNISATKVGKLLRQELPEVSKFLTNLVTKKKAKNEARAATKFAENKKTKK